MTTPARNNYQVISMPGRRTYRYKGFPLQDWPGVIVTIGRSSEVRPASINVPLINNRRANAPWDHRGHLGTYSGGVVTISNRQCPPGQLEEETWLDGSFWSNCLFQRTELTPPNHLTNEAILEALEKLKGQDVNLSQALAEAGKTSNLLTGAAKSIGRAVKSFRQYHPRLWPRVIANQLGNAARKENIPEEWLKLQYGWKPLMQDVHGACNALSEQWGGKFTPMITVSGSAKCRDRMEYVIGGPYGSTMPSFDVIQHKVNVGLSYAIVDPELALFSSLGLTNPAVLAWEILPYSFVADWFSPIGQWLGVLDATFGYQFLDGYKSSKSKAFQGLGNPVYRQPYGSGYKIEGFNPQVRNRWSQFVRTVYTSTPVPGIYVKSPISAGHIANAMSLLAQSLK